MRLQRTSQSVLLYFGATILSVISLVGLASSSLNENAKLGLLVGVLTFFLGVFTIEATRRESIKRNEKPDPITRRDIVVMIGLALVFTALSPYFMMRISDGTDLRIKKAKIVLLEKGCTDIGRFIDETPTLTPGQFVSGPSKSTVPEVQRFQCTDGSITNFAVRRTIPEFKNIFSMWGFELGEDRK